MASTHAKAVRRAGVLQRLSDRLGVQQADLHAQAKGDAEMALILTLERVADAIETNVQAQERGDLRSVIAAASDDELTALPGIGDKSLSQLREWAATEPQQDVDDAHDQQAEEAAEESAPVPPVTVETVEAEPMETVETVEIVPADEAPVDVPTDDTSANKGKGKNR